jgi:hypothetical protein
MWASSDEPNEPHGLCSVSYPMVKTALRTAEAEGLIKVERGSRYNTITVSAKWERGWTATAMRLRMGHADTTQSGAGRRDRFKASQHRVRRLADALIALGWPRIRSPAPKVCSIRGDHALGHSGTFS